MKNIYDDRDWDASVPETSTEEFFECVNILWRLAGNVENRECYKFIDLFMFSPSDELENVVPIDLIRDGEGVIVLEFLRDIESKKSGIV